MPVVTITLMAEARDRLHWNARSARLCEHVGAAFSLMLEEKMALGLAAPPPERVPVESLGEQELVETALEERGRRARAEDDGPVGRSGSALDRLHRHQHAQRQDLSRGAARAASRASRIARAPTSARTRWGPASTSCTSLRRSSGEFTPRS